MAQLRSQHICCLVLIATPNGYRKPLETARGAGKLRRQSHGWQSRGDHALPMLQPENCTKNRIKAAPTQTAAETTRLLPAGLQAQALTMERSRLCLKLLETPHHGQYESSKGDVNWGTSTAPCMGSLKGMNPPAPNSVSSPPGFSDHPSADPDDKSQPRLHRPAPGLVPWCAALPALSSVRQSQCHPRKSGSLGSILHPTWLINSTPFPGGSLEAVQRQEGRGF